MSFGTGGYQELSGNEVPVTLGPDIHSYTDIQQLHQHQRPSVDPRSQQFQNGEHHIHSSNTQLSIKTNNIQATTRYTRHLCIGGLVLSTFIGIALTAAGSADRRQDRVLQKPYIFKELVPLGLNLLVVICTESLGYIHTKTQQWSLWEENRLEFNTNIRLFSYARRSWANGVVLSTINLLALTMSYTATSAILLSEDKGHEPNNGKMVELSFSRTGPICLGISLLVQALICFLGLRTTRIRSWSSHPLVNALVVRDLSLDSTLTVHDPQMTSRRHQILAQSSALQQGTRQPSPFRFHRSVRTMLWVLGVTLVVLTIWMSVVLWEALRTGSGSSWALLPVRGGDSSFDSPWVVLSFFNVISGRELRVLVQIALTLVIQLFVTVGLHISELAVLLSRDEDAWRAAGRQSGANVQASSFLTVLKSWKSLTLLLFKPVIHWMYGLAMYITYDGLVMMAPQLVYLIGLWLLLILFVLFLSFKRPRGLQPATYGHLPTLVEMLHDCKLDHKGRLVWSPKLEPYAGAMELESPVRTGYGSRPEGKRYSGLARLWLQPPFGKAPRVPENGPVAFY